MVQLIRWHNSFLVRMISLSNCIDIVDSCTSVKKDDVFNIRIFRKAVLKKQWLSRIWNFLTHFPTFSRTCNIRVLEAGFDSVRSVEGRRLPSPCTRTWQINGRIWCYYEHSYQTLTEPSKTFHNWKEVTFFSISETIEILPNLTFAQLTHGNVP